MQMYCQDTISNPSSENWLFLFAGAIIGAIIGLFLSLLWKHFSDWYFKVKILKPRLGEYKITLKNGRPFSKKMERACIKKVNGRKMTIVIETKDEKHGNAEGEIEFTSNNYGRGFYKHRNSNLYGFYEFILLPENKICVFRKYTTDLPTDNRISHVPVETSLIWEKQKPKCDWC